MNNFCHFSTDRKYRYLLEHVFDPLLPLRRVMWIGLNPSTADEQQLDPTLRRIRAFSKAWGYTSFVMTNLFAFRATKPEDMYMADDPVGPENDWALSSWARQCDGIVAAWGSGQLNGRFLFRSGEVRRVLAATGVDVMCVGTTRDGFPRHPLYVAGKTLPLPYKIAA